MISKAGATKDFTVLVVLSTDLKEGGCWYMVGWDCFQLI
jgi:hypothetical protein